MSKKLIDLYKKAVNHFLEKKYSEALAGFATIVQADPEHLWSRYRIGITLEALNKHNRAFEVYNSLAWHCLKAGFPLVGLVAAKKAANLQASIDETLEVMSSLYSLESNRVDQDSSLPDLPVLDPAAVTDQIVSVDEKLSATAEQLAKSFQDARYPKKLPPVPLFSLLTTEAFFPILECIESHTYQPGETFIQEGDPCSSIYLLAHGEVEVNEGPDTQSRTLARLVSGSVFGEMALITDAPRVASAIALRETEILELSLSDLEEAAEDLDDITWAVAKF
ncbi:MAG: cyclic nucleotide-binding domain-containing protein, partial [Deltaproteobacteria bacterium]|nr:cyclic nucleotide-binding domain-containing protein [Deltaproteobacteria bacterium]